MKIKNHLSKIFTSLLIFITMGVDAQISFNQSVYLVNENVVVSGTDLVVEVENAIAGQSQQISLGTTTIDLGSSSKSGLYLVSFILADNSRTTYFIAISNSTIEIDNSIFDSNNSDNSSAEQKNIFKQVFKFFKDKPANQRFKPFTTGLQNYCVNNAVDIVQNVSFCIAAESADGSVLILNSICKDMSIGNLKALSLEVYKELFKEMKDGGYITQQQYEDLDVDSYVNLAKMLQNDCGAFFDFLADKIDNHDLKIALSYQGQLCSSTVTIIKKYKKLP